MLHQLRSELDINSLINAIDGAMFSNGVGSSVPRSSLYPGQAAASVTGTIGSAFAANPLGLTAMSQLGTNATAVGINIYINPGLITSGLSNNAALLLHEGLHLLGFDDADLQTALGYPVDPNNAKEITTRLQKDCVNGRATTDMMGRPLVLALLHASLCCSQQQPLAQQEAPEKPPELATVSVTVTTTFGGPVGKAMVILRLGSVEKYRQTGETLRFEKIPFGHYGIEIQAAGLLTRREPVVIDRPEVHLWFGLFVSPLEGVGLAEVAGIIAPHESNPKALWVRLISLYSSDSLEDQVAPFGEFRFVDVYPGRYILVVFNNEKLIETQPVDISAGKVRLNLNLSK